MPATSGLNEVYQGQLDDIFLAYQKFTNPRTAAWMKNYEHNYVFNNTSEINTIRKAIEQLASIHRIGAAYPDNAIKRSIKLRTDINGKR
jgi:hypothetical protein